MAYIPTKDADYALWSANFSNLIVADPGLYGLEAADAAIISAQEVIWQAAYLLATTLSTRTRVTVADKDGEKLTSLQINRQYAAIIRADSGVADEDKTALGLHIPDPTPTPVPAPTTYPQIAVLLCGNNQQQLFITDQLTPDTKSKPFGVAGCLLFRTVSVTAQSPLVNPVLVGVITRADTVLDTTGLTKGSYANYQGQWFNRKGQIGPTGPVTSFIIT